MVGVNRSVPGSCGGDPFVWPLAVRDRRGVQTLIAVSGLACFLSMIMANTLLVGGTMRIDGRTGSASRRAKLALPSVDSTAAIAGGPGLALVSTWVRRS